MMVEIENLVQLQKLDDEIRTLDSRLSAIPKEIEALEKEIQNERKNLEDAQTAHAEAQKGQRAHEVELGATEEKAKKYKDQLMNVKTNEEYKLMQHQIEVAMKEVSNVEDKILADFDRVKELEETKRQRQAELEKGQREITAQQRELDAERQRLEAEREERRKVREALLPQIPEDLFGDYDRIARTRGGVAMAEAIEERCQICMVRLRPQAFQELRQGEKILHCENCKRILYYREREQPAAT